MDIIKKTNGQVWLVQSGNLEKILPATAIVEVKSANEIIVKQGMNQFTSIFVSEIDNYQIEPASPIAFSGNVYDLMLILSDFFFELTGTGATPDLDDVLSVGNSAGTFDIDMNNNDLLNVNTITAVGDLFLNPVGSVDMNGKTLNMTGGEIHNIPLMHSKNNTDLVIEGKGTADLIFTTNNLQRLVLPDSGKVIFYTIADLNGQNITNINLASGKTNADLTIESLGTGGLNFKTGGATRLTIKDSGVFVGLPVDIHLAVSDETTALTTGTAKVTFRMPYQMTLTAVRASLTTAQSSGSIFTVDINENGSSVLGTKLTIDNTEKTSVTAATPATITTSILTSDSEITIDIDQVGNGTAKGLKILLIGTRQ